MSSISEKIFCAFCRLERRYYSKKHLNWTNVLLSLSAAILTMYIFWQEFNPSVAFIFTVYLIIVEVFITLRWRLSLPCPHCGFDIVLYKKNTKLACEKVITRLDAQKNSANFLFSSQDPFKNLPKLPSKKSSFKNLTN